MRDTARVVVTAILLAVAAVAAATRMRDVSRWPWWVAAATVAAAALMRTWLPLVTAAVALGVAYAARGRMRTGAAVVLAVLAAVFATSAVWLLALAASVR